MENNESNNDEYKINIENVQTYKEENKIIKNDRNKEMENSEKDIPLTESLEKIVKTSFLKEFVTLKATEVTNPYQCVKQLFLDGRVSKQYETELNQLQNKISEKISQKIGSNFNMNEFWLVQCGLKEGESFQGFECFNENGDIVKINNENEKHLIIDIWSSNNDSNEFIQNKINLVKSLTESFKNENKILSDYFTFVGISDDENFGRWKTKIFEQDLNQYIPQYSNKNILHTVGIKNTGIHNLIIVDKKGIIKFIGKSLSVDLEKTIKNSIENLEEINPSINENYELLASDYENNPNPWWNEMDTLTKCDIVSSVNYNLKHIGCPSTTFYVVSKYLYSNDGLKTCSIPIFTGNMFESEYDILETYAIDLQNNWNFNNFQFNCKVVSLY